MVVVPIISHLYIKVSHVLKPMIKSTIMVESFLTLRKKKKKNQVPTETPKPRTVLVQKGENNMNITMPATAASNSINPIHVQFRTFSVELKRDDENNMVPFVPCSINRKGRNFIKRVTGPIMPKLMTSLLHAKGGGRMMSS
jgi:hypothetical protein